MSDDAFQRTRTVAAGSQIDVWSGNATQLSFQITIEDLDNNGTGVQLVIQPNDPTIAAFTFLDRDPPTSPFGPHRFRVGPDGFQTILQAKPGSAGQNCTVTYSFKWDG